MIKSNNRSTNFLDAKYGVLDTHTKTCPRCGNEFSVICRLSQLNNPKRVNIYCSSECSRARTLSDETKNKISTSVKKTCPKRSFDSKLCVHCGNLFVPTRAKQIMCSRKCVHAANYVKMFNAFIEDHRANPEKYSNLQKQLYASGIQRVGGGKTKWYTYNDMRVQGTYELRTCLVLDAMVTAGDIYKWEYTNDKVPYIGFDEKSHTYLIDFKVYVSDSEFYYLETKGYEKSVDKLKWNAVTESGFNLVVWFREQIEINESKYAIDKNEYKKYASVVQSG